MKPKAGLIEGFIKRQEQLNISEIWLVDIEEGREKLEIDIEVRYYHLLMS